MHIKWNTAAFETLERPASFKPSSREAADDFSDLLYAWDEVKRARAAKMQQRRAAKARVGIRSFSWEA